MCPDLVLRLDGVDGCPCGEIQGTAFEYPVSIPLTPFIAIPIEIVATHSIAPLRAKPRETPHTSDTQLMGSTPSGMKPWDIISMLMMRPRIAWSTCS